MKNIFCPNFSNKQVKQEFDELTAKVGENVAYYLWNKSNGEGLQQALALLDNETQSVSVEDIDFLDQRRIKQDTSRVFLTQLNPAISQTFALKTRKDIPSIKNSSVQLRIKGAEEKGYFEIVKEIEPNNVYDVHFKTTDYENNPFSQDEKNQLFQAVVDVLPEGAVVSTTGEISKGGVSGLKQLTTRGLIDSGETRTITSKETKTDVEIPMLVKPTEKQLGKISLKQKLNKAIENASSVWLRFTRISNPKANTEQTSPYSAMCRVFQELKLPISKLPIDATVEELQDHLQFYLSNAKTYWQETLDVLRNPYHDPNVVYRLLESYLKYPSSVYSDTQMQIIKENFPKLFDDKYKARYKQILGWYKHTLKSKKPTESDVLKYRGIQSKIAAIQKMIDFSEQVPNWKNILKNYAQKSFNNLVSDGKSAQASDQTDAFQKIQNFVETVFSQDFKFNTGTGLKGVSYGNVTADVLLKKLLKFGSTTQNAIIIKLLGRIRENNVTINIARYGVNTHRGKQFRNNTALGVYSSTSNEITLYLDLLETRDEDTFKRAAIHEIIHALTIQKMSESPSFVWSIQQLIDTIEDRHKPKYKVYSDLWTIERPYGLTDPFEFVAEFFSNPNFQQFLREEPAVYENKVITVFEKFLGLLLNALGLKKESTNIFSQIQPFMDVLLLDSNKSFNEMLITAGFNDKSDAFAAQLYYERHPQDEGDQNLYYLSNEVSIRKQIENDTTPARAHAKAAFLQFDDQFTKYKKIAKDKDNIEYYGSRFRLVNSDDHPALTRKYKRYEDASAAIHNEGLDLVAEPYKPKGSYTYFVNFHRKKDLLSQWEKLAKEFNDISVTTLLQNPYADNLFSDGVVTKDGVQTTAKQLLSVISKPLPGVKQRVMRSVGVPMLAEFILTRVGKQQLLDNVKIVLTDDVEKFRRTSTRGAYMVRGFYEKSTNTVYINRQSNFQPGEIEYTIVHEICHSLTAKQLFLEKYKNSEFYREICNFHKLVADEISKKIFEDVKYRLELQGLKINNIEELYSYERDGVKPYSYLQSVDEFFSEFFINPDLRSYLESIPMLTQKSNRFEQFINFIKNLFVNIFGGHNTPSLQNNALATALTQFDQLIRNGELFEGEKGALTTSQQEKYQEDNKLDYSGAVDSVLDSALQSKTDANQQIDFIITGLQTRIKSMKTRGAKITAITKLQQQLSRYEDLKAHNEDCILIQNFISDSKDILKGILSKLQIVTKQPGIVSNENLNALWDEVIGFYGPLLNSINEKLSHSDYFDHALTPEQKNALIDDLKHATNDYTQCKGVYQNIVKRKAIDLVSQLSEKYGVPEEDVIQYIEDELNQTDEDISKLSLWLQSAKSVSDLATRVLFRRLSDINNDVQGYSNNLAQEVIREFGGLTKPQMLLFFERGRDGRLTGNLVRDLNYGQFNADYKDFLAKLDEKYGVDDQSPQLLPESEYQKYMAEKNDWLDQHCERKFKKEYYDEFNKLIPAARTALKIANTTINSIVMQVTDDTGVHLDQLTEKDWAKLDDAYLQRKNLSNIYDFEGNLKTGEELEIAESIAKFNESVEGKLKTLEQDQKAIDTEIAKRKSEMTDIDFQSWYNRNISVKYSQRFMDELEQLQQRDYGPYESLVAALKEERRKLLQLCKHHYSYEPDAKYLSASAKQRIREIDNELQKIAVALPSGDKTRAEQINEIATFAVTDRYKQDKAAAQKAGTKAYERWLNENHTFNKYGEPEPYSYYTVLRPKYRWGLALGYSQFHKELDPSSDWVNENYDFSSKEAYQPKRAEYDNTEAYQNATATTQQRYCYDLTLKIMRESLKKISFINQNREYKLPQIEGDAVDYLTHKNKFWKGFAAWVKDRFNVKQSDEDFNLSEVQRPDGSRLFFIPTHYLQMNDPSKISTNLPMLLVQFAKMAENFKQKNEAKADFELVEKLLKNRPLIKNNKQLKKGEETNTYQKYSQFLKMNLYGQRTDRVKININGTETDVTKSLQSTKQYATSANLCHNLAAVGKGFFQGVNKSFVEALAGRYYTATNYFKELGRLGLNLPQMILNLGNYRQNNTTLAIMENFGIATDLNSKLTGLNYNRVVRFFIKHLMWGEWSAVDFLVKAPVVRAVMADYKYIPEFGKVMSSRQYVRAKTNDYRKKSVEKKLVSEFRRLKTFSMNDVFEAKDGVLKVKNKYLQYESAILSKETRNSIRNVSSWLTNRIDGILSDEDKTQVMTNAVSGNLFVHRSFFINNFEDNFLTKHQYNPQIEDDIEAKYRTFAICFLDFFKNAYIAIKTRDFTLQNKDQYKTPDAIQIYNIKRTVIQITMMTVWTYFAAIFATKWWKNEDASWFKQWLGYCIAGMAYEERAEYMPSDFISQIKSPSATIAPVENITALFKVFNPYYYEQYFDGEEIESGPYEGFKKWEKAAIRVIPGVRGAVESRGILNKWNYLNNQLDKSTKDLREKYGDE